MHITRYKLSYIHTNQLVIASNSSTKPNIAEFELFQLEHCIIMLFAIIITNL